MRILLSLVLLLGISLSYAGRGVPVLRYEVKSDTLNTSLGVDEVWIHGKVLKAGQPVANGLVGTVDNEITVNTNAKGEYSIKIATSDTAIYFFKVGHDEIVTNGVKFRAQHELVIDFTTIDNQEMFISFKPIIYLYPENSTSVNVELDVHGETTFTYPVYNEGWNVTADPSGTLTDSKGRTYPYLFWEAEHENLSFNIQNYTVNNGYQIKTDTSSQFLENVLTQLGLNSTEKTDFITFWGPKIEANEYALVQFLIDDAYAKEIADISITPSPDVLRRVYIKFSPLEEYNYVVKTNPINIAPLNRTGFTVIEWGGTNLQFPKNEF